MKVQNKVMNSGSRVLGEPGSRVMGCGSEGSEVGRIRFVPLVALCWAEEAVLLGESKTESHRHRLDRV